MPRAPRFRRAWTVAALCGLLAVFVLGAPAGAQEGTDDGDPGTDTTVPLISPAGGEADEPSLSDQASERIDMVVIALVVLAVAVAVATVVFFRRTKPERVTAAEAAVVSGRLREVRRPDAVEAAGPEVHGVQSAYGDPVEDMSASDFRGPG